MNIKAFGIRLTILREKRGLNRYQLAKNTGVCYSTIRDLEQGKYKDVQVGTCEKLAEGLDMELHKFFRETEIT